jgi:hypothetical protein
MPFLTLYNAYTVKCWFAMHRNCYGGLTFFKPNLFFLFYLLVPPLTLQILVPFAGKMDIYRREARNDACDD